MRTWLKIILALVVIVIVAFVGISAYLGYSLTRADRTPAAGTPADLGLTYEDVSFNSTRDGIELQGWFVQAGDSAPVIILVHGDGGNRADASIGLLDITGALVRHGFNVLAFDLRGCGESGGNMVTGGYKEKYDVEGAVAYVASRGYDRIGLMGFSLGAISSLMAAAETPAVDAVVADSSFADLNDIMAQEFHKRTKAPGIFLNPILFMIKLMYGVDFAAIKPVQAVPLISPRPLFVIQGELDDLVPPGDAMRLYDAAHGPLNQVWVVPGAEHTRAYKHDPEEYMNRVTDFFDKAFSPALEEQLTTEG